MTPLKKTDSDYEERIQKAIRAIRVGEELNVPAASEVFEVNRRTLYRRLGGTTLSRVEADEVQQRLTPAQENAIVKGCFSQDDIGFPPRLDMVKDMVLHVKKKRIGVQPPPLAKAGCHDFRRDIHP